MSTIDDLRNELADRAANVPPGQHLDRLAGIKRKRTAQRRTMAAGAAGATALAIAAVVALVPGSAELAEPTPPPPATKPAKPTEDTSPPSLAGAAVPVVEEKGVEFYETPGLGTLDGYAVDEPGQRRLEFSFVAGADVVNYDHVCFGAPEVDPPSPDALMVSITVNGHPQSSVSCDPSPSPLPRSPSAGSGYANERDARIWEGYGVVEGSEVEVVVELETFDREPASDPGVTIGAGFWSMRAAPVHEVAPDVLEPGVVVHGGVNYRYRESVSASVGEGDSFPAPEHPSDTPVLAVWGKTGSGGTFTMYPGRPGNFVGHEHRAGSRQHQRVHPHR